MGKAPEALAYVTIAAIVLVIINRIQEMTSPRIPGVWIVAIGTDHALDGSV